MEKAAHEPTAHKTAIHDETVHSAAERGHVATDQYV